MAQERLNKVMANAGIASRRACDELIEAGRVTVNGRVVTELGVKVDPDLDQVRVDGDLLKPRSSSRRSYLMLYKPAGVLSVFDDPRGRPGLESLLKGPVRLYPVGRLDLDSEGLLLLTDDGDMTLKLSHPRYEHAKTYLVLVDRVPGTDTLARFRRGIQLDDGVTASSQWRVLEHPAVVPPTDDPDATEGVWVHVTMHEGRKRQIRRMAAAENLQVRRLVRIGVGSLKLDRKLRPGESRPLTRRELESLLEEAEGEGPPIVPRRREQSNPPSAHRALRADGSMPGPRSVALRSGGPRSGPKPSGPRRDDAPDRGPRPGPRPSGPRRDDAPERQPDRRGPYAGGPRPAGPRRDDAPERQPGRRGPYAGGPRPGGPRRDDAPERGPRPGPRPSGPRRDDAPERQPDRRGPYAGGPRPAGPRRDDAPDRGPRPGPRSSGPRRDDAPERGPRPGPRPSGPRPAGQRREDAPERESGRRGPARDDQQGRVPRREPGPGQQRPPGSRPPRPAGQRQPGGRPNHPPRTGPRKPRKS